MASKKRGRSFVKYKSNNPEFGYNIADGGLGGKTERQKEYEKNASYPTKCNQTGVIYSSMSEASKQTGVCISSVRKSCIDGSVFKGLSFSRAYNEISE